MTTSVASTINLSSLGLGSGLDDASIISQLVAIESAPLTQLQTEASNVTSAASTLASFSSSLNALQSAANALADPTTYNVYSATSSAPQVVASTAPGAVAGVHTVDVSQLAAAQITYSDPQTSNSAALGLSGALGLTVGGTTYAVTVGSGDSLTSIAAAISSSGAPVTASVVYDGSQYRLDVQGNQTGAANAISFQESGFSLGLSTASNTYQAAQDTMATIDGIAVSSSTAQISGAIPGVTLAVTGTTSGAAAISVGTSASSLTSELQSFVSAYNAVVSAGHTDIGYGSTPASNALLSGDPGIRSSLSQLSSLIAGSAAGADGTLTTLGSIGLNLNTDGSLQLDTSTLAQALQSDPTGVEKLLVTSSAESLSGVMGTISSTIDSVANNAGSVLKSEAQYYANRSTEISADETSMQARIAAYQTQLQTEFSNTDETVNEERSLFSDVGGTGTFM
jgi:flagellar hook-associated protein 2